MASLLAVLTGAKVKLSDLLTWRFWQPEAKVDPAELWARYEAGELGEIPE
jgi:hypothetical protein